jgi:nitrite reductase/ring-hydroxylating ferredoxin subunit
MSELTATVTSAPPGFFAVARTGDVPPGWVLRTSAGGRDVALSNVDGEFYAVDNSCTHAGGPLAPNRLSPACTLECPWHNSVFDARTGAVVSGPALKPARTYPVEVHDGTVYVSVDLKKPAPVPTGPPPGASTGG